MSNRIPVSLNWLVKKRAEVDGELTRLKHERIVFIEWSDSRIRKLQIDRTLALHEIKINPNKIPTKQHQPIAHKLKHGQLTSLILECVKKSGSASTKQIIYFVAIESGTDVEDKVSYRTLYNSIRYRLKNLCAQDVLERLPTKSQSEMRYFRLKA